MGKILFILIVFFSYGIINAQTFYKQDSLEFTPRVQVGSGGYLGTHKCIPRSSGFSYSNVSGYDHGVFLKTIFNISKSLSLSIDLRYAERSGYYDFQNDVFINKFLLEISGFQELLAINYTIRNWKETELLGITTGVAYNQMRYQYSNVYYGTFQPYYVPLKIGGIDSDIGDPINFLSYIFSINKRIRLSHRNYLVVFNEYELQLNTLNIDNKIYNLQTNNIQSYTTGFKSFSLRLGTYLTF